jgi:TolB-like protein
VRKAGNRVRITGQLINAVTGTHLWADLPNAAMLLSRANRIERI